MSAHRRKGFRGRFAGFLALLTLSIDVPAATLSAGTATIAPGAQQTVFINLTGDGSTAGVQFEVRFDAAALGTPTVLARNGAACSYGTNPVPRVVVIHSSFDANPLPSATLCHVTFNVPAATPVGTYLLDVTTQSSGSGCFDASASPSPCNTVDGSITVASGTPPSVSYTPPPNTQIDLPGGGIGAETRASVDMQAIGGSGVGRVDVECTADAPFSLPVEDTFSFNVGAPPGTVDIGCTLTGAEQAGNLNCVETDIPGGAARLRVWPLICPAGSAATMAVGSVLGNRGGAVAVDVSLIGDGVVHSAVGDLVFDPGVLTPTQVSGANGGACFLRPAPNETRIAFSVPPGPSPLPDQELAYCRMVFLVSGSAPIDSSALTLDATTCLNAGNAPVTCLTLDGNVAVSAFDSAPRPGGALSMTALPGQSSVSSSILAINFGGTAIEVDGCTPDPAPGFIINPAGAFSLAATTFRTIGVECTPPGAGQPPRVTDLSCVLQDTTPARVVRYRLVCATVDARGPIPGSSLGGSGTAAGDEVGTALATTLAPNGDEIMVIGAPFAGADDGGRAFVIVRPAGSAPVGPAAKHAALGIHERLDAKAAHALSATTAIGDKFGGAVAIDTAGETIAIGAPGSGLGGAGRVFVFVRPAGGWTTLDAPDLVIDAPSGASANDTVPDDFGAQVAFAANGMLVVGAPLADVGTTGADAGAVYGYAPGSDVAADVVRSPQAETGAGFGGAIASNGDALAIGAPLENAGGNVDQGAVYVMTAPGAPAEPTRRITAEASAIGDKFGQSVAFVNRMLVVGAPGDNTSAGTDAGSATVFTGDTGGGFTERMTLVPSGEPSQQAGTSVATNGDLVLLGAPFAIVDGRPSQGRVFAFGLPESPSGSVDVAIIDSPAGQAGDRFGGNLAASSRRLLIGVPKDDNELGIGGTAVQVDEGRADPFLFDRISRSGFE